MYRFVLDHRKFVYLLEILQQHYFQVVTEQAQEINNYTYFTQTYRWTGSVREGRTGCVTYTLNWLINHLRSLPRLAPSVLATRCESRAVLSHPNTSGVLLTIATLGLLQVSCGCHLKSLYYHQCHFLRVAYRFKMK